MLFNSFAFALFLPIVFLTYWIIPHKFRCGLLLAASYYFYMSWNPKYIIWIILTTFVSYVAGLELVKHSNVRIRKAILIATLSICLGVVFVYKYFDFFSCSMISLLGKFTIDVNPITLNLVLPVGISFYTFQTLSYVIDVYRGEIQPERNLGIYATYISFFPQLVAGPIERSKNLLPQIKSEKEFDYDMALYGARQMLWGYFKKIAVVVYVALQTMIY